MSGTTSLCLTQQWHNATHEPLVGGLLYSFQAGTLNPQNAYRTASLTSGDEYANPHTLDASGRIPQMFYADGAVRLILTDSQGVAQFDYDNVPVLGSSEGGGGVDTTDVTRLYGTGDMKIKYGTGTLSGYVRGNGRTIGSATSGASEFADATAQALFQYFWNNDALLTVAPSGRGASAVADWTANKTIATPDFRGVVIGGLDGMGSSRASILAAAKWDVLGQAFGGVEAPAILQANIPNYTLSAAGLVFNGSPSGNLDTSTMSDRGYSPTHGHPGSTGTWGGGASIGNFGGGGTFVSTSAVALTIAAANIDHSHYFSFTPAGTIGGTVTSGGSGTAFNITQPTRLVTVYFRL